MHCLKTVVWSPSHMEQPGGIWNVRCPPSTWLAEGGKHPYLRSNSVTAAGEWAVRIRSMWMRRAFHTPSSNSCSRSTVSSEYRSRPGIQSMNAFCNCQGQPCSGSYCSEHPHDCWNPGPTTQLLLHMGARDLETLEDGFPGLLDHTEKPGGRLPHVLAPFIVYSFPQVRYLCEQYMATWAWALPHVLDVCD